MGLQNRKRSGVIAKKIGMSRVFTDSGAVVPVTLLEISNVVLDHRTNDKDGYNAVILGSGEAKPNKVNKPMQGYLKKHKLNPVKIMKEFRADSLLDIGSEIKPSYFKEGQFVDAKGVSIGKGFAGGMKRHNFSGLFATHGVSISHRSIGSTGQCQDPGRTFKGKKMPGHMGAEQVTIQNLKVFSVDDELGLLCVIGSVPGKKGSFILVSDAAKKDQQVG